MLSRPTVLRRRLEAQLSAVGHEAQRQRRTARGGCHSELAGGVAEEEGGLAHLGHGKPQVGLDDYRES